MPTCTNNALWRDGAIGCVVHIKDECLVSSGIVHFLQPERTFPFNESHDHEAIIVFALWPEDRTPFEHRLLIFLKEGTRIRCAIFIRQIQKNLSPALP